MAEEFSLERIAKLVSDLEQELSGAPAGSPKVAALRSEIAALKQTLASTDTSRPGPDPELASRLQGTHRNLDDLVASVEGEVLRDTPYLTELGRILGLV